jgi:CheY-like chemotaxis protein
VADAPAGRARILVVEDEALVRLLLVEMLTDLGHEIVAEASKLDTAVKVAAEADYDLAVLDLNLGNGITYDVVDIVLGRGKAVVLSTGYGGGGIGRKYAGCTVLQKPFVQDAIDRAIQLSLRQTARAQDARSA